MPILIVNHSEEFRGLVLRDRVLIGRRPFNTIMLADPAVSRLHAWIGWRDGYWTLFDAGSRIGTVVNTRVLEEPHRLVDGDEIRIGQTMISYQEGDELPSDLTPIDPAPQRPAADPYDGGIYFDCACGGPMWVAASMAGATGRCRYCGERLVVPHMSGGKGRPIAPPAAVAPTARRKKAAPEVVKSAAAVETVVHPAVVEPPPIPASPPLPPPATQVGTCSICQTAIRADEDQTSCPSCHLTFHRQCWEENLGCGAYGCDQVNVLASPAEVPAAASETEAAVQFSALSYDPEHNPPPATFPWEPVLLALSFVAMALGALAYGLPSAIIQLWALVYLLIKKPRRKGMVIAALFVGLIGVLAGFVTSMFWWRQIRVWEWIRK